jgi:DNA-binding XRE family transcriptional regulator
MQLQYYTYILMFFLNFIAKTNMIPKKVLESHSDVNQKLEQIGAKVRMLRKEMSPNYEDFAAKSNINKVTLNKIERGESVSIRLFLLTLQKMGISLEDFFKGL